jgi:hypothetical protein
MFRMMQHRSFYKKVDPLNIALGKRDLSNKKVINQSVFE